MVCEKQTALDIIKNNLSELALDKNCVIITDVIKDRKKLVSQARILNEEIQNKSESKILDRYIEDQEANNLSYKNHISAKSQKYFDSYNWTDTVGLYMELKKKHPEFHKLSQDCLSILNTISTDGFDEKISLLEKKFSYIGEDIVKHYSNTLDIQINEAPFASFDEHMYAIEKYFNDYTLLKNEKIETIITQLNGKLKEFEIFSLNIKSIIKELNKFNIETLNSYLESNFIFKYFKRTFSDVHKKIDSQFNLLKSTISDHKYEEILNRELQSNEDLVALENNLDKKLKTLKSDITLLEDKNEQLELIKKYDKEFEQIISNNFNEVTKQINSGDFSNAIL